MIPSTPTFNSKDLLADGVSVVKSTIMSRLDALTGVFSVPQLYHAGQCLGGFFQGRLKAFADYLDFSGIRRVFDIGCGPGHISAKLPPSVDYIGFDADEKYIRYANARFGSPKRRFYNRLFDASAAADFGNPDLVMMNGLLHHVDDAVGRSILLDAYRAINPGGVVFAVDPCFVEDQSAVDRYLKENDRGKFVRTEAGYRSLVPAEASHSDLFLRKDLSRLPYTSIITRLRKPA